MIGNGGEGQSGIAGKAFFIKQKVHRTDQVRLRAPDAVLSRRMGGTTSSLTVTLQEACGNRAGQQGELRTIQTL